MDKKQITCPNCCAPIKASQLLEVECPYCGSKFENPLNKEDNENDVIKKIIPFSVTEDDVPKTLFNCFVNQDDVPPHIFNDLTILSLKQYYLPMYLFSGKYEAAWACTVVYHGKDKNGNELTDYRPINGVAKGYFDKLSLASTDSGIPNGVGQYADVLSDTSVLNAKAVKFEPSYLINAKGESIQVAKCNVSNEDAWNKKSLQESIKRKGWDAADYQTRNWEKQDYNVTLNGSVKNYELLLVPVWYGEYSYNGQKYFFAMDGRGGNFDYSYPKDFTNYERGWKVLARIFLMAVLLIVIAVCTENKGLSNLLVLIGGIILTWRFILEKRKSLEELSVEKEIGRAKFCGEEVPDASSNYENFKRTNKVLMWLLILAFGTWCLGKQLIKHINEKKEIAHEQRLLEQVPEVFTKITPDLFFYQSKDEIGHLRQDVRKSLNKIGFVNEKDLRLQCGEKYTYYSDETPLVSIIINFRADDLYYNSYDEIQSIKITIGNDRLARNFTESFKSQLTDKGYVLKISPPSNSYPNRPYESHMLMGKETYRKDGSGLNVHYATYNAAVIMGNDIECYAKDEFNENMKTGFKLTPSGTSDNNDTIIDEEALESAY